MEHESRISKWALTIVLLALSFFSLARAEVVILDSQKYSAEYSAISASGFRNVFDSLGRGIDPDLVFVFKECGVINAYYSAYNKSITICYEFLADISSFLQERQRRSGIYDSPKIQATLFSAILLDMVLHEVGHAVIDLRKVPVIGGEEDAADRIATVFLLDSINSDPADGQLMFESILAFKWAGKFGLMDRWILGERLYADEHPLNEQRIFNVLCLAYGSNQMLFSGLVQQYKLPPSRAVRCENEYQAAKSAIHQLLR